MYNTPLTLPWIFDRCLEFEPFYPYLIILFTILGGFLSTLFFFFIKRTGLPDKTKIIVSSIPIICANLFYLFLIIKSMTVAGDSGGLVVLFMIFLTNALWYFLIKLNILTPKAPKKYTLRNTVVSFVLGIVALTPATALFITIVGFLTCIQASFIPTLEAAHPIHAIIKEKFKSGTNVPTTLRDLEAINPEKYKIVRSRAKQAFMFDQSKNAYTWIIRPSRHYVIVFDNTKDIVIYKLDNGRYYYDSDQTVLYPPAYTGPWHLLPP